jgi:hypothetical protein
MDSAHRPIPISGHGHTTVMGFRGPPGVARVPTQAQAATPTTDTTIHHTPARIPR